MYERDPVPNMTSKAANPQRRSISGVTILKATCWLALGALFAFVQCRYIGWNEPSFLLVVMLMWWYFSWRERRRKFIVRQRGAYPP
jgi:hypothetical protein